MKNFFKKNMLTIIVGAVIILFVVLSILIKEKSADISEDIKEWIKATEKDEYVVTVIGQEECYYCNLFKPTMDEVHEEYGFKLYWHEVDVLRKKNIKDYNAVLDTYPKEGYKGTPYTFITKNGEFISYLSGNASKESLVEFLESNGVITLND